MLDQDPHLATNPIQIEIHVCRAGHGGTTLQPAIRGQSDRLPLAWQTIQTLSSEALRTMIKWSINSGHSPKMGTHKKKEERERERKSRRTIEKKQGVTISSHKCLVNSYSSRVDRACWLKAYVQEVNSCI